MPFIYTVPQNHVLLIKRFGKHTRVQKEGLRLKIPFIETFKFVEGWNRIANKYRYYIELSEQQTDTPPRQCQTQDNVTIDANASVYWKIVDPIKAVYDVDILPKSIADIALNALRTNIGKLRLNQVLSERQSLNQKIAAELIETAYKWGIEFTRVEIQEVTYSNETAEAMMQEMASERKKIALITEAEGVAQAEITKAKASAEATLIKAQAQANSLKLIGEGESNYMLQLMKNTSKESVNQIILAQKYIDGMKIITENPSSKVFLPSDFKGTYEIS